MERKRILTGDRPTGKLHLGHYLGSLRNRVDLQDQFDSLFIIADLHMLTTQQRKDQVERVAQNVRDIVLDYLAAGIDPERSTIFVQSAVPETHELNLLLEMLVTVPRLERVPSLKEMARDAGLDAMPLGLLGYPVLQAADILLPRAHLVPVGKDNEAHVEVAREIARRFNRLYDDVFPVPDSLIGDVPLVGTDGHAKMSKTRQNAIYLSDDEAAVNRKVMSVYTDPNRVRSDIPGRVEGNPVFIYHDAFNPDLAEVRDLKDRYRRGAVGDAEVKERLAKSINELLAPMRLRRAEYAGSSGLVEDILVAGTRRVRGLAQETMDQVYEAMGLYGPRLLKTYSLPLVDSQVPTVLAC
ncbi:tryptophan--tRNA ligase [Chloroflexota bacterium]